MTSTEEKLARELGFRVNEQGDFENADGVYLVSQQTNHALRLWRKCLELSEQIGSLRQDVIAWNALRLRVAPYTCSACNVKYLITMQPLFCPNCGVDHEEQYESAGI